MAQECAKDQASTDEMRAPRLTDLSNFNEDEMANDPLFSSVAVGQYEEKQQSKAEKLMIFRLTSSRWQEAVKER